MDKMREEFEEYYAKDLLPKLMKAPLFSLMDAEDAVNFSHVFYGTWKKSRAALVVELPMWFHAPNGNQVYSATEVKGALKDAGIKYK